MIFGLLSLKSVPSNSMLTVLLQTQFYFSMCTLGFPCVPCREADAEGPQGRALSSRNTQSHWVQTHSQRRNSQKHLTQRFLNSEGLRIICRACYNTGCWISPYPQFLIHCVWGGAWEFVSSKFPDAAAGPLTTLWGLMGPSGQASKSNVRRRWYRIIHCRAHKI